jgi:FkbM family methyltransferase
LITVIRQLLSRVFGNGAKKAVVTPGEVVELRVPGLTTRLLMRVHRGPDLYISEQIRSRGIWEAEESRLLMSLLGQGQTFVDVGANIGYFTMLGSALVGSAGKVYAFEPDPDNFRLLVENCQLNKLSNVACEEVALSDRNGLGTLYLSDDNLGDHMIYAADGERRACAIRLLKGDEYFSGRRGGIDVVKVDVQGAEYDVLQGMASVLNNALPALTLILEFSPNSLRAAGSSGKQLLQLLVDMGLHFYIFDHRRHGLLLCDAGQIAKWVKLTEMDPSSQGFINLVCSGALLTELTDIQVDNNEQGLSDPLEYLLASNLLAWDGRRCDSECFNRYLYFSNGWSFPEPWGVWSDGDSSRIKFYPQAPAADVEVIELHFEGQYYGVSEPTRVMCNGVELGVFDLVDCVIQLPARLLRHPDVDIVLYHTGVLSPAEVEGGSDDRRLKYGLRSMAWSVPKAAPSIGDKL